MLIRAKAKRRLRGSGARCEVLQQLVVRPLQDGDGAAGRIHLRRGHRAAGLHNKIIRSHLQYLKYIEHITLHL